nr:c-type cytochrome [Cytophagales bacterium]
EETVKTGKLYNGSDKGRIYRISPKNGGPAKWLNTLSLGKVTTDELVENLANPNGWHRRTAQRLLLDRMPADATALLEKTATESISPVGRVHALWTLEGLGKTSPAALQANLSHPKPEVRENTVEIAETHLQRTPGLAADLLRLENDPDPAVRFQLLCLLVKDIENKWTHYAALSALDVNPAKIFQNAVQTLADRPTDGRKLFFQNVAALISLTGDETSIADVIRTATTTPTAQTGWWQAASLEGLALTLPMTGFEATRLADAKSRLLANVTAQTPPELRKASLKMLAFTGVPSGPALQKLVAQAADAGTEPGFRADALELISFADTKPPMSLFTQNLDPRQPTAVQQAALKALGRRSGNEPCRAVLAKWPSLTPALREEAVEMFMHDTDRMNLLLAAVADGRVQRGTVGWRRTVSLMNADDMPVRRRAREVFAVTDDRNEVVQKYQSALTLPGNAQRGLAVFEQSCATCHQMNGRGRAFGPDLASLKNRTPAAIMTDILNPNRSIADGYEYWTAETTDGRQISGVLASENASAITLRDLSGKDTPLSRNAIRKLTAASGSAMPVGLENALTPQQMADLLAFLKK